MKATASELDAFRRGPDHGAGRGKEIDRLERAWRKSKANLEKLVPFVLIEFAVSATADSVAALTLVEAGARTGLNPEFIDRARAVKARPDLWAEFMDRTTTLDEAYRRAVKRAVSEEKKRARENA